MLATLLAVAPAGATHVQCGDVVTQDTTLDSDLTCAGPGLIVGASNVTVDLSGHTIEGAGAGNGIQLVPDPELANADVKVRNGTIRGFDAGVLTEADTTSVSGLRLEGNGTGFLCNYAKACALVESVLRDNTTGMAGVFADSSPDRPGAVRNNSFTQNTEALVLSGYPADVTDNRFVENTGRGITIDYWSGLPVTVTKNVIARNGEEGVQVVYQGHVLMADNRITGNGGSGVHLDAFGSDFGGIEAQIEHNRIADNAGDGIQVGSDVHGLIAHNRTNSNGDDGIEIRPLPTECCTAVTVHANTAFFNVDLGIEAVGGTTDGGGNKAKHNGNTAECVGVVCR